MPASPNHFLDIAGMSSGDLRGIIDTACQMKQDPKGNRPLEGKTLAMIFDKPSTRTRVSFDVGMRQLGGETLLLSAADMQLGRGETIADTARVLSRYVDAIMIRTTGHDRLLELAEFATIPVVNGLTDDSHPCQIMADVMTIREKLGGIEGKKVCWSGDNNNVLNSLIEATTTFGYDLSIAVPETHPPSSKRIEQSVGEGAHISVYHDPVEAAADSDCVMTDTWASMGFEDSADGHNTFSPYQVNDAVMGAAKDDAIFMHCLPAHRGEEVTADVIDGPQSVVFDQAENRLHVQKAILAWCFK